MKYRINAGKYRSPISIMKRETTKSTYGDSTNSWTTLYTTRAGIFPISGSEKFQADITTNETTHRVHMRYLPGISPSMKIFYNGREFQITSIVNTAERNVELQLYCKEIVK